MANCVATGSGDMNFGTSAVANVGTVNLNVQGVLLMELLVELFRRRYKSGSQQSTAGSKNASSIVDTINITATSEKSALSVDVAFGNNQMPPFEKTQPGFRDYLDSMTYAMINGRLVLSAVHRFGSA